MKTRGLCYLTTSNKRYIENTDKETHRSIRLETNNQTINNDRKHYDKYTDV
jgi:hypothetical protein